MGKEYGGFSRRHREGLLSAVSAGVFFILVGFLFVTKPAFSTKVLDFFRDWDVVRVPNTQISLPAPQHLGSHLDVYRAVEQFSFIWAIFQLVILVFRFAAQSPLSKKAETVSNFVFWLGAYFLINTMLVRTITPASWFAFWSVIIMLIGGSLIVRAIILAAGFAARKA